jgi:hypothetical protein
MVNPRALPASDARGLFFFTLDEFIHTIAPYTEARESRLICLPAKAVNSARVLGSGSFSTMNK